ncbi:siderophore ABC transporter substrate-binding protein [Algicella marina]|uniref:ABC transporter substrate-binding protein n=1 Tax=Algicella marina TaxID=2683284 RepID=A0A6P1T0A3_9RHOB|nr:siderophore ABC transporter substrate-binding protein [Algicella marina]QHQ35151.1 ABC transporter substrate-binding protein [Algicella marina]
MLRKLALALTLAAAPAVAEEVTVETYAGPVAVETAPETIAVFDIAALDTLDALGVKPTGLVRPYYLPFLEDAAEGTEPVGSLFEPDFEAVNALQPDLIIAGGRSQEQVPNLAKLAPTLDMTIWEDTIGQGLARLEAYGKIFGKEDEAAELHAEFEAKLEAAKAAVGGKGNALIVLTNGPKISAYGAAGRFGWLHTALELPEAVEAVEQTTHGEAISFEFIREVDPDILLVIDRLSATGQEGDSAATTLDNALIRDTKAWKSGQVVFLSAAPVYISGGGIQSLNIVMDEIQAAFPGN